jgi:hypothetical protein
MDLEELFTNLSYGVLSGMSIGGEGTGVIPVQHRPKLVSYTNKSLLALYSRFVLVERELILRLIADRDTYVFEKVYADQDPTVGVKYIEDTAEAPFEEDLLKILQIFDQDMVEMRVNDPGDPRSLFTPDHKSLLVPLVRTAEYLHILYQAKHPKLVVAPPVGVTQQIFLPELLHAALEHHIAYQVFSPSTGQEHTVKASEHLAAYNALCLEVEVKDLATTSFVQSHTKLEDRGFV